MKWLILLALISCGQKNPPAKDVGDSDGDQIPNYLEANTELQKYVAEVIPFAKTEGTITFKLDNKFESVKLGNEQDIAGNAMKLLTKTLNTIKTEDYFSELSLLKPEVNTFNIPDGQYLVTLNLETNEKPDFITLTDGKAELEIGAFTKRLEFNVSGEELRLILARKLHFNMKRNTAENPYSVESTIRTRTYRVFYYDGRTSKVHYVSNELAFTRYLKLSGIQESHELKSFSGFSQTDPTPFWWTRKVGEKDIIVVKASLKEISAFHTSNFKSIAGQITRSNGSATNSFTVKKQPSTKYVMKLRGSKVQNIMQESTRNYHVGGQAQMDCRQWLRTVVSTTTVAVTKAELLNAVLIHSKEKSEALIDYKADITEGIDGEGHYLELAMNETPEEFTILLASRPSNTYVKTGVYKTVCDNGSPVYGGSNTNEEGQMNLKIESFIEKID